MLKMLICLSFLCPFTLWAQSLEVVGACEKTPIAHWVRGEFKEQSLGAFTLEAFDHMGLRYQGSERGINSIEDSVVGMDAIEILSKTEMRSYGWCFTINGELSEVYADDIAMLSSKDHVVWFFGFAHYLAGKWVAQCVPAYTVRPAKLCD